MSVGMLNKVVNLTHIATFRLGWLRHFTPKLHYNQNATDKGVMHQGIKMILNLQFAHHSHQWVFWVS